MKVRKLLEVLRQVLDYVVRRGASMRL